jgi:hypothetical protein
VFAERVLDLALAGFLKIAHDFGEERKCDSLRVLFIPNHNAGETIFSHMRL